MLHLQRYWEWLERDEPSEPVRIAVGTFLAALDERPYIYPSVPIPEQSCQPVYQVREAQLEVPSEPDVWVQYRHVYASDEIMILDIRRR